MELADYKFSPFYKKGSRFFNPHCTISKLGFFNLLLWQMGLYGDKGEAKRVPESFDYPNPKEPIDAEKPVACWINHSTFLIQVGGLHLLTDPIWSDRCSPLSFLGPRRDYPPGLAIKELPQIDLILISHNHYDHLDLRSVKELMSRNRSAYWIVPIGVKKWMRKQGISRCIELAWWQTLSLDLTSQQSTSGIEITAVPAQHFSRRSFFDRNKTLWSGYVVEFKKPRFSGKKMYFVGDTGYNQLDFKAIGSRFKGIDLSLIPIGAYLPARLMSPFHINPEQAVLVHKEVGSKMSIGMHFKTFRLSDEPLDLPPYDLYRSLIDAKVDLKAFRLIEMGQSVNW